MYASHGIMGLFMITHQRNGALSIAKKVFDEHPLSHDEQGNSKGHKSYENPNNIFWSAFSTPATYGLL